MAPACSRGIGSWCPLVSPTDDAGQFYYKAFLEVVPFADPVLVESLIRKDRFPAGSQPVSASCRTLAGSCIPLVNYT